LDGWTEEMLPDGWRPLLLGERPSCGDQLFTDDRWIIVNLHTPAKGYEPHQRTQRPLASPKPKLREVPLCADDVPFMSAIKGFKDGNHEWASIVNVTPDGLYYSGPNGHIEFVLWRHLMEEGQINRSIPLTGKWDATAWEKCSRTEEVPA
jgi:hypothetical protein